MRTRAFRPLLAAILSAGCATTPTLQPLATSPTTPKGAPLAQEQGVLLVARGDSWRGNPSDLERVLTPVEVRLENHGERPLRIDTADFALVGASRFEYAALKSEQLSDASLTGVGGSGADGQDVNGEEAVGVAPGFAWGPGFYGMGWYNPLYDPFYGPYAYWYRPPPQPLPTRDMLREALPQGTLTPGGTTTGFLYFQSVGDRESQVTLRARLVDARTGEQFGTLDIPFHVRS
ncbi:hypothetical protein [Melittangium boletus]|uniref:Lipoprotein n=1 Tax=Melittangium boletus DSM 14713 TaxID=1294270 RepID=A0A250IEF9_9BACT|nr:hypothetical protein [Melittangium boletus]ATB29336.1 hypothetical protein MEBOL_002785 [Melittangium boletus DSM 14713]